MAMAASCIAYGADVTEKASGNDHGTHIVILATSDLHGNILGYSYEDTADFCDNEVKGLLVDRLADEIKEYLYAYEDYEEAKDDNRDATFNLNCEREELLKELEEFGSPLAIITPSINSINRLLSLSGFSGFKVIEHEDLYYNAPYAAVSLFSKYTIKKRSVKAFSHGSQTIYGITAAICIQQCQG